MDLIDRLESFLEGQGGDETARDRRRGERATDDGPPGGNDVENQRSGVEYECASCGNRFDEVAHSCPRCGSHELRERSGPEFEPLGG